ncbi:hypothetical protein [Burkholderia glumae]|uniref:hypothetical protein n=1 Tax=Burkholderia glumae TaxID=337 RepID=UPI00203728EB|nr:hypothetical protein [Burkholderia glumae]MCM2538727.1 hypothetical protein [Burkholderia glumae]
MMRYVVSGGVTRVVSEREKIWHATKFVLPIGAISLVLAGVLVLSVRQGWVAGTTDNWLVHVLAAVAKFLSDPVFTLIETVCVIYILLVAFMARFRIVYRWAKTVLVKCILFYNIFPLAYFFSMFWGIDFVPMSPQAWASPMLLFLGGVGLYLLPVDAPPQYEIEKKK